MFPYIPWPHLSERGSVYPLSSHILDCHILLLSVHDPLANFHYNQLMPMLLEGCLSIYFFNRENKTVVLVLEKVLKC